MNISIPNSLALSTKTSLALVFAIGSSVLATAQTGKEWNDPTITSVNRETSHTTGIPMTSENDVVQNDMTLSPWYQSLDGQWKFQWVGTPSKATDNMCAKDYDDAAWTDIDVPSSWQVWGLRHGKAWDKPLYCNVAYPFAFDHTTFSVMADRPSWFTYKDAMANPVGTYRRTFTVPANWDGREIYVRFNGVGHGYYLWVNGQRVGYSEDSYVPSEFNITDYVVTGENSIALQVFRFTSGSFLECQDYWRLTGIQRHCFLWAAPKTQIRDYFFTTDLDDNYVNAKASVNVLLTGLGNVSGATVEAKILDNNVPIASVSQAAAAELTLEMDVTAPRLWSAETPNLYDLVLTLKDNQDNIIDVRGGKVGFREVGIRADGALIINGKRMVFHGVNRHDFSPVNGRAITDEEIEEDIRTMKRLNINAVRTSHYPNDPVFYDLCDKYGLYVLAEADVECHAYQELSSLELFRPAMVERSENQIRWLRNHVCIFMWSYGNESGRGENFRYVSEAVKALDKTRLTHYEGNSDYADVSSTMYADYNSIQRIGSERKGKLGQRPHVQCENSHSMGNSMGNVREMFDLYDYYPCLAGEFIWDFKDQGLLTNTSTGVSYWAYGGDFGDVPNDGNFCINGLVRPDWSLTSKSYNTKKVYQPLEFKAVGTSQFRVRNKMAFLPSTTYDVGYELMDEYGSVIASGTIDREVAAGDSATISIDLSPLSVVDATQERFIHFIARQRTATAWADAGYVVAEEKLPVRAAAKPMYVPATSEALNINDGQTSITLSNSRFSATFSKSQGTLTSYVYDGVEMLAKPLLLNAFRLPTDNDGRHCESWDNMGLRKFTVRGKGSEVISSVDGQNATVNLMSTYTGKNGNTFDVSLNVVVCADATLMFNAFIRPSLTGAIIPKLGFRLEMPASMEQFSWFGRGPWDSYRDRKEACLPAIYNSTVTDQREDFIMPQENGTKQDVRWISLTDDSGKGLLFIAPDQMAASAVHFRPEDNYTDRNNRAKHTYQFKTCQTTVVSLDASTRGLGNASCGPDVMDKYELKTANTSFRFFIMPLSSGDDAAAKARVDMPVCQPVTCERLSTGRIKMTTTTKNATIWYSIDGGDYVKYSTTILHKEACTITAYCTANGLMDSPKRTYTYSLFISKGTWRLVSTDSQHSDNEARLAFDGNPETFWHTEYGNNTPECPHNIIVDMKRIYNVTAFTYLARQDGMQNGMVKTYEVYLSVDGETWGNAVAQGEFKNTTALQSVPLSTATPARYLKFVALSEINGNAWSSAAEIGIEADADLTGINDVMDNDNTASHAYFRFMYDLSGRRVGSTQHGGLYIVGGKKVLVTDNDN